MISTQEPINKFLFLSKLMAMGVSFEKQSKNYGTLLTSDHSPQELKSTMIDRCWAPQQSSFRV